MFLKVVLQKVYVISMIAYKTRHTQVFNVTLVHDDDHDDNTPLLQDLEPQKLEIYISAKGMPGDLYPYGLWLFCGAPNCRELNVHAACNFTALPASNKDVKQFCKDFIRYIRFFWFFQYVKQH